MIIRKEFLFSIRFISLSTNLQLSIDICIMSKLIKHVKLFKKRRKKKDGLGSVILISCRTRAGPGPIL